MPSYKRQEIKFMSRGLNLTRPQDLLATQTHPYLLNMRQYFQGAFQNRPGLVAINPTPLADLNLHSVIRLNDYVYNEFTRVVGAGDSLYTNTVAPEAFDEQATGFSGNPLTLLTIRPPRSPEPWVYIGDEVKTGKVRVDGTFYGHGVAPPVVSPYAQQEATSYKVIDAFEAVGAWTPGGTAGAISAPVRVTTTIAQIVYDSGNTGWATISPTALDENIQPGMLLTVNAGETILVEYVSEAVTTTTVQGIQYDAGVTGACTIQLAAPTHGLARDSMLQLNASEVVRVLSVTDGPGGLPSFRCVTIGTIAAGNAVVGLRSFRAVFANTHIVGETLISNNLSSTVATGVGWLNLLTVLDLSSVNSRPVADEDEIHISIKLDIVNNLTEGRIEFDVDSTTNDFTKNYYYKAFRANDLAPAVSNTLTTLQAQQRVLQRSQIDNTYLNKLDTLGMEAGVDLPTDFTEPAQPPTTQTILGASQWTELRFKIKPSELIRVGSDKSRTLHDVAAVRIQFQVTGATVVNVDAWWVGGTFGADALPDVGIGAPYNYRYVYRSMVTGASSNPSPPMREGIFPRRQRVRGTVTPSADPQVDQIDIYRTGGALTSVDGGVPWYYVMTIPNGSPSFIDDYPDDVVIRNSQLDFDNFQPFLDMDIPRSGTCDVVGTEITNTGGDVFDVRWPAGTVIIINNVPYTLFVQPASTTHLSLAENAGKQTGVTFQILSPRLMHQPLPAIWGPFGTGTIEPVLFACGSARQPAHVFWTKPGNPDGNSAYGSLQLTSPSEPLINGVVFRAQTFVFSSEALYILTPSIQQGRLVFSGSRVAGNRGLFSRYAMCVGDEGIFYLSRDGIYLTEGGGSVSITDEFLYPLFVHEGAPPATTVNGIVPPDFCREGDLRLIYGESTVYFDFVDINGDRATLLYDIKLKGWYYYKYGPGAITHYFEEGKNLNTMLVCGADGRLHLSSGNLDNGASIPVAVHTGWFDGDDPRSNKQWANGMLDFAGCGVVVHTLADFNTVPTGDVILYSDGCPQFQASWTLPTVQWTATASVQEANEAIAGWIIP